MKDTITFFGGLNTTGGVQILLGSGDTGMMFDFGIPHQGLFTAPFIHLNVPMRPLAKRELRQYLLTRMAPPIIDLYDKEYLESLGKQDLNNIWGNKVFPTYKNMYVFISHIHQDHMALLPYLHKDITVFMHKDAYSVYQAMVSAGYYYDTKAQIYPLSDKQEIDLSDFTLQLVEVDHNTPGTSGFLLKTSENNVAFTGDWRRHGRHSDRMETFIEKCKTEQIDMLITESTRVNQTSIFKKENDGKEETVLDAYRQLVSNAKGMVYLNVLPFDVERVADIILQTKNVGKTLVMEENIAKFWYDSTRNGIDVLNNHTSLQDVDTIKVLQAHKDQSIDLPFQTITVDEIVQNKGQYVLHLNYKSLPYLIEFERLGDQTNKSCYIHADHPVDKAILNKWLTEFNISYHNISNKGHASPDDISYLVEQINPKVVIPVHGISPSLLDSKGVRKYHPTYGESVEVGSILA